MVCWVPIHNPCFVFDFCITINCLGEVKCDLTLFVERSYGYFWWFSHFLVLLVCIDRRGLSIKVFFVVFGFFNYDNLSWEICLLRIIINVFLFHVKVDEVRVSCIVLGNFQVKNYKGILVSWFRELNPFLTTIVCH